MLAQPRAKLLSVRSAGDAATAAVELRGDRPLSFTTLKLSSPPRVVVDCADTGVGEVPPQVEVGDGTVRRIGVASAGARTARVVIELVADAEFDVRASGNRIEVRVPRVAPLLASAAAREVGAAARAATGAAGKEVRSGTAGGEPPPLVTVVEPPPPAVAAPAPPAPAAPSPPPRAIEAPAPPAAVAVEPAAAEPVPERAVAAARKEEPRDEELPPGRVAMRQETSQPPREIEKAVPAAPLVARREPVPPPAPQAKAAPQPPVAGQRDEVFASAREQAAAAVRKEETAAIERARVRDADAQKRASLPTVALQGSRPAMREEAAPEPARVAEQRTIASAAPARSAPAETHSPAAPLPAARPTSVGADQGPPPARVGSVPAPAQRGSPSKRSDRRRLAAAQPARQLITGIGFRPAKGGVVIVRSDKLLEYAVSAETGVLLIHLPHTAIPLPNNRRPLDTHFFDGPVQRIVPLVVPGGTEVRIELAGHADYQLAQSDSVLTVTFSARQ